MEVQHYFSKQVLVGPLCGQSNTPCFDIVRKHLRGILRIFDIFHNFVKKTTN